MEIAWNSWAIVGAPFVALAGVAVYFLLKRHKEVSATEHILKQ